MPIGRRRRPQVQAGLLLAWLVVAAVDQFTPVPTVVVGTLAVLTVIALGAAVTVGWRRRL